MMPARLLLTLMIAALMQFGLLPAVFAKGLSVTPMKAKSGTEYHFYEKNNLEIGWELQRPNKRDQKIKLCIPAAFTTKTGTIVGIYSLNGKVGNRKSISKPIGGALLIVDGEFQIFPTRKGAAFTKEFVASLEDRKASMFQQYQLVEKGAPAQFKDKRKFQMRAIVKFSDGRTGVLESDNSIAFKRFIADLVALGIEDALYTDMGSFDEGWYRDARTSRIMPIGNICTRTSDQTNWVIFREP